MMDTKTLGYFKGIPRTVLDLGDIVAGKSSGREDDGERTMSMNMGLALDEMAVAPLVYRAAMAKGLGTLLDLLNGAGSIRTSGNPRDSRWPL